MTPVTSAQITSAEEINEGFFKISDKEIGMVSLRCSPFNGGVTHLFFWVSWQLSWACEEGLFFCVGLGVIPCGCVEGVIPSGCVEGLFFCVGLGVIPCGSVGGVIPRCIGVIPSVCVAMGFDHSMQVCVLVF